MGKALPGSFFDNRLKVYTLLLLPALLVYFRSLSFGFTVLDEQWMILQNGNFLANWSSMMSAFSEPVAEIYYRPLFMISLVIDYHFSKFSPVSYHVTNLLLHLLATALLYRLLQCYKVEKKAAFFLTMLFSLHPVMVHAVVWVPGRNDLMLCVFTLLSLIFLHRYIDEKKILFALLHVLSFVCALFTKESAAVLPFIYAAVIYLSQSLKRTPIAIGAFYVLLAGWVSFFIIWLVLRNGVVTHVKSFNMQEAFTHVVQVFMLYMGKTLLPLQQSVFPTLKNTSLLPGVVSVALLILLWWKPGVSDKRIAALGLFIFLSLLALPIWFGAAKSGGEHYEHRLYVSMTGLVLFFSQVKFNWKSKNVTYAVIAIGLVYALRTSLRMSVYKTTESFLECGVKEAPDYYLFYYQRAEMLSHATNFKDALPYCDKAISLRPDKAELYNNRGVALFDLGRNEKALPDFIKAIQLSPKEARYYLNRCAAYYVAKDTVMAMHDLQMMRQLMPALIPANLDKAVTDYWVALVDRYNKHVEADPDNAKLYYERALLHYKVKMDVVAAADLKKAAQLDPSNMAYKFVPVGIP